ncbi:MAG: hypothetical protein WBP85_14395, partial [Terracidiphilus sp.]
VQTAGIVDAEANFQLTKRLLAEDLLPEPGPGVIGVNALAAYRSVDAAEEDWIAASPQVKSETLIRVERAAMTRAGSLVLRPPFRCDFAESHGHIGGVFHQLGLGLRRFDLARKSVF